MDRSFNCALSGIDVNSITQALMNGTGPQLYVNLTNSRANLQKETISNRAPTYKTFSQKHISNHANAPTPYSRKRTHKYRHSHTQQMQDHSHQVSPDCSLKNMPSVSNRNTSILRKISATSLIKIQFNSDTRLQHILKEILCLTREADVVSDLMINNDIADMKKQHNLFLDLEDDSRSISSSGSESELEEEILDEMQFLGTGGVSDYVGGMEESSGDFENLLTDSDSEKTETADEGSSESTQESGLKVGNPVPGSVQNNDSVGVQFKLEPDELIIDEKAFDFDVQNEQRKLSEDPERISTYTDNNKIMDIKTEKDENVSIIPSGEYNDHVEDIKVNPTVLCKDVHWNAHQTPQQPLCLTDKGVDENPESELSESSEEHPFADSSSDYIISDLDAPRPGHISKKFFLVERINKRRRTLVEDKQGVEEKKAKEAKDEELINLASNKDSKKTIGPNCSCKLKCFTKISDTQKEKILQQFYDIGDKDDQDIYLSRLITVSTVQRKRPTTGDGREKCSSFQYKIRIGTEKIKICKTAFCSLHAITKHRVSKIAKNLANSHIILL